MRALLKLNTAVGGQKQWVLLVYLCSACVVLHGPLQSDGFLSTQHIQCQYDVHISL